MKTEYTVIIADDHPIFRAGLRDIIEKTNRYRVIAEAESGITAWQYYLSYKPDMMILDISMGELNGLEVAEKILADNKHALCIMMTMYSEEAFCKRALSLGVKGYLLKEDAAKTIINCLDKVMRKERFISDCLGSIEDYKADKYEQTPEQVLTDKELKILTSIANLKTNSEIANEHHISIRTVQNHRYNISSKLHLSGRQALLQFAVKWAEKQSI